MGASIRGTQRLGGGGDGELLLLTCSYEKGEDNQVRGRYHCRKVITKKKNMPVRKKNKQKREPKLTEAAMTEFSKKGSTKRRITGGYEPRTGQKSTLLLRGGKRKKNMEEKAPLI